MIDIRDAGAVARDQAPEDAFLLTLPPKTVVTQLAAPGRPVRLLGTRRLTLAGARALSPALYWLGPRAGGHPLGAITLYRYNAGWRCGCATARCWCGITGRSCRRRSWETGSCRSSRS